MRISMENMKLYIEKLEKRKIIIDCLITNIEKDLERLKEENKMLELSISSLSKTIEIKKIDEETENFHRRNRGRIYFEKLRKEKLKEKK